MTSNSYPLVSGRKISNKFLIPKLTEKERLAVQTMSDEEMSFCMDLYDFLKHIVKTQTDPIFQDGFELGQWHLEYVDKSLHIMASPSMDPDFRDLLAKQVWEALERTPNKYFEIVK